MVGGHRDVENIGRKMVGILTLSELSMARSMLPAFPFLLRIKNG